MTVGDAAVARPDRNGRGILLLLGGIFIFSWQDIIVRELSGGYPVLEFVFARTVFSIFPILALAVLDGGVAALKPSQPGLHLLRGVLMLCAYTSYYLAVASAPLATAVALFYWGPLLVTAFSALFLHERVGARRWAAVGAGLVGVVLIVDPWESASFEPGALIAVVSAAFYASSVMITRRLGRSDSGVSMVTSQMLVYLVGSGIAGLLMQDIAYDADAHPAVQFMLRGWVMPTAFNLGLMATCGLIAAGGFYGLTQAYRFGSPSVVAPFEYTGMIWGIVWGFAFWSEVPGSTTWIGIAVIVGAGLYVLHREAVRNRAAVTGRPLRQRL